MMNIRKLLCLMLCLLVCLSLAAVTATAADEESRHSIDAAYYNADRLNALGLFQGAATFSNGMPDYQLERPATRVEALVMLIRLMGKEAEVLGGNWTNPFVDVSENCAWASDYVGYAYETGLTLGSGTDTAGNALFGLGDVTSQQYLAFVLRAMGYTDSDTGSTLYDEAVALSRQKGILDAPEDEHALFINLEQFWRADLAIVSWKAMYADTKAGGSLCAKLVAEGVFTESDFFAADSLERIDHATADPLRLSSGARTFSFTIVNMDRMSKLWLSDGSYVGDDWYTTDIGWVEFTVQQNPLTAVLTVWSDIDFENISELKVRYTKTEGTNTALFGCPITNGGRYWMDEELYNNGGFLMTEH